MTRWIVAGGAFLVSLDSMINVAFPAMAAGLAVGPAEIRWVIVTYVLTYALVSFAAGALGDRVGHAAVFGAGVASTALGLGLAGMAPTLGWLLAGRVVQGVAGGFVYGTAPALIARAVPPEGRGRALGFLNTAIGVAYAVSPPAGGDLVARFGWRAVFHARLPLAAAMGLWALAALRGRGEPSSGPAVRPRDLLRPPVLALALLSFLGNAGIFAIWLLTPFDLVDRRGLDVRTAAVLFMLTPLGMAAGAPLAGRLTDRVGPRGPMLVGFAIETLGLAMLAAADQPTPLPALAGALFAAGLGLGVVQVPSMAALMAEFGAGQQGAAGGLTFLARTLGTAAGASAFGALFAAVRATHGPDAAFASAFGAAAAVVAAAVVACAILAAVCRRPTGGSSSRSA